MACGIGNSMQFIKKQAGNITKLMRTQVPDKLVRDLAAYSVHDPNCGITGVHMYPLGGLSKTAGWSYSILDGEFSLQEDGIKVHTEV